ncbi:MAG: hypothetical protein ACK5AO_07175 [bacterium]|jgi:RsiW-degrading membrane proteinase PrsW (M82 family)
MINQQNNEIQQYVVVLKNNNKKLVEQTGWLFALFSLLLFSFTLYQDPSNKVLYLFILLILSMALINVINRKQKRQMRFSPLLITAGIGMLSSTDMPLIGIFLLVAAFVERRTSAKKEIGFSDQGIQFNYNKQRKIKWIDLNNVVLRDDLLTIDLKNNSIIQVEVDDDEDADYEVGEDEFNDYCRTQLDKS